MAITDEQVAAIMKTWYDGLRGGRCPRCNIAWAWKPSGSAPVHGAHCSKCGARLQQTCLQNITRFPIREGFPWYRTNTGPRGLLTRHIWLQGIDPQPHYWFTFDSGPGCDARQEGRRLVRQWAPADVAAPVWLARSK